MRVHWYTMSTQSVEVERELGVGPWVAGRVNGAVLAQERPGALAALTELKKQKEASGATGRMSGLGQASGRASGLGHASGLGQTSEEVLHLQQHQEQQQHLKRR